MRSDQVPNGRYSQGGQTTVVGNKIGWWERQIFPKSELDVKFTLTKKYHRRPDILAYDMYGKAALQWLVLQYNSISDVTTEFVEGAEIMLPTKGRVFSEMLTKKQKY